MPRPLRFAMAVLLLVMSAAVTVPFVRLHTASPLERTDAEVADGALPRLKFLRQELEAGAAQQMQGLFPEGYFFMYVLYGLSWVDLAARDGQLYDKAVEQARWAMRHLDSADGRAVFDSELDPDYGVFYAGWTLLLRSGIARLAGPDAPERDMVRMDAETLSSAFNAKLNETGSPFLTAYPGQAWPCDSAVAIAALKVASQVAGGDYTSLITRWLAAADSRRDPATGLLPHTVDPQNGQPTSGARATSQVIILRFWHEVDPARAAKDWLRFRELFTSRVPGLPGVREYPHGTNAGGDVDSGPLVLGMSGSASAVALGDAIVYRDGPAAASLTGLAEAAGLPVELGGTRRYLLGQLPVADAFLTWSYTARPGVAEAQASSGPSGFWRLIWYPIMGLILMFWLMWLSQGLGSDSRWRRYARDLACRARQRSRRTADTAG